MQSGWLRSSFFVPAGIAFLIYKNKGDNCRRPHCTRGCPFDRWKENL